jgi:predicted N-formylglutamate amidohydrolase
VASLKPGGGLVVSCEHASHCLPARCRDLGLDAATLRSHIAWDIGAREVARALAKALGCVLHEGRYSRLLVDLNRSLGHRSLMAESSFGVVVPGNRDLEPHEKARRIAEYWRPYRDALARSVEHAIRRHGSCLHVSVHSFTPEVGGEARNADFGLLYDPARKGEGALAREWARRIAPFGLRVRMNYPYRGTSDGVTSALRRSFPASRYTAIEIELNQRLLGNRTGRTHIARVTRQSFFATLRS